MVAANLWVGSTSAQSPTGRTFCFFYLSPPQGTRGALRVKNEILDLDNFSKVFGGSVGEYQGELG